MLDVYKLEEIIFCGQHTVYLVDRIILGQNQPFYSIYVILYNLCALRIICAAITILYR